MNEMLSIGQFAQAAGLSSRALRIYDEVGLLVPATVDAHTGYRWYLPSQLRQAALIRAGRAAGMPLADVGALLAEDPARAHERIDRHWHTLARAHGAVRAVIDQLHGLVDGDEMTEVDRMDVQAIVVYADDMDRSRRFYEGGLGLPQVYEHHGRYGYQVGASRLLLHPRGEGTDMPARAPGEVSGYGVEVSLGVDDVDALVERLRAGGVPVEEEPRDEPWGERDAVVRDPDGLRVRLSQSLPETWLASSLPK
jgi:DNA polymerase III subunit beta